MNKDIDLALRFSTGIKNGAEYFTDLNGFQVLMRLNLRMHMFKKKSSY